MSYGEILASSSTSTPPAASASRGGGGGRGGVSQGLYMVLAYVMDLVALTVDADVESERLLRPDTATMTKERMAMKATAAMTIAMSCQLET